MGKENSLKRKKTRKKYCSYEIKLTKKEKNKKKAPFVIQARKVKVLRKTQTIEYVKLFVKSTHLC